MNGTAKAVAEAVVLQPILPIDLAHLSWLDLMLPPSLLLLSLLLHITGNQRPLKTLELAHIYRTKTAHARFLPSTAKHHFQYPLLSLGLDLEALENKQLDLDRWFRYDSRKWSLLGLWPEGYVTAITHKSSSRSIMQRLKDVLAVRGVPTSDVSRVYTLSMPAYLGWQGINPLVVHFCYSQDAQQAMHLTTVVLEVHNTFEERYIYVLRIAIGEDERVARGFSHQWTFPRAFHVSPFNDRKGFYRVAITDPLHSTSYPHTLTSCTPFPNVNIKILYLTPETKQKKLMASLTGSGRPMTESSILKSLISLPLALLSTTPRILYEAFRLHYQKRLDVYARPEPYLKDLPPALATSSNPVEAQGLEGSIFWQSRDWTTRYLEKCLVSLLQRRILEMQAEGKSISFTLRSTDASVDDIVLGPSSAQERLTLTYLSPLLFSDLFLFPSLDTALAIGADTERRWHISNVALFRQMLAPKPVCGSLDRACAVVRALYLRWLSGSGLQAATTEHFANRSQSPKMLLCLLYLVWTDMLGYLLFRLTRSRFIPLGSPWEAFARLQQNDVK